MHPEANNADSAITGLKKAKELLFLEAQNHMPAGARMQREHTLHRLEEIIRTNASVDKAGQASDYGRLKNLFATLYSLSYTGEILDWIRQTHALPAVNETTLDEAVAAVGVCAHRLLGAPEMKQWLENAAKQPMDQADTANLSLMRRQWMESAGLEESLVAALSRATSASFAKWEMAKPLSDFAGFLPSFEEVLRLTVRKANALGAIFHVSGYQAMLGLSSFNPGLRNETVNAVFGRLRMRLPGLIREAMQKQAKLPPSIPLPEVTVEAQKRVAARLMRALGLEENHARLDESAHPFSTGQHDDVRITTHYYPDDMLRAIMGVIHECGHALYSRGLPGPWRGQPVGEAQSMWVHESQSLFWEMQVASSRAFMEFLSRLIQEELGLGGEAWGAQNLYRLATQVEPTLIRTDADEVTYPAHVILRHDLEQRLIDGSLQAKDVPAAWAEGMRAMLGIEVPDHCRGCMQDVHWPSGAIGYFPAYTFGALAAAQLMQAARTALPGMDSLIQSGDFTPIREWLTGHIYCHGALYSGEELIQKATGKPLSEDAWLAHIHARYLC